MVALILAVAAIAAGGGTAPVWSPDGHEIAYVGPAPYQTFVGETLTDLDNLNHIFVVPADGSGPPRVAVTAPGQDTIQTLAFASGGFVYQDSNYTLWRANAGKPPTKVTIDGVAGLSGVTFAISPDGETVAFDAPCGCRLAQADRVETVSVAGGRTRRLSGYPAEDPSFSPDGKDVVFAGVRSLVVVPTWGGPARSLGMVGYSPEWSPDGKWIAFLGRGGAFEIVPASGGTARTLIAGEIYPKSVRTFSWSPDSSSLVFETGTTMGTVDLAGTVTRFSLPGLRLIAWASPPSWSPDGTSIAFAARGAKGDDDLRVYVVGANGQELRRIA